MSSPTGSVNDFLNRAIAGQEIVAGSIPPPRVAQAASPVGKPRGVDVGLLRVATTIGTGAARGLGLEHGHGQPGFLSPVRHGLADRS